MYLLDTMNDSNTIAFILLGLLISYLILYSIIKSAVKAGNKEVIQQLRMLNQLKVEEMKNQGLTQGQLQKMIDDIFANKKR